MEISAHIALAVKKSEIRNQKSEFKIIKISLNMNASQKAKIPV